MVEDVRGWINGTLIGADGYFAPSGFAASLPLYSPPLHGSFVLSVIDGSARPAPFRMCADEARVRAFVSHMQDAGFPLPTEPPDATFRWPHGMAQMHAKPRATPDRYT